MLKLRPIIDQQSNLDNFFSIINVQSYTSSFNLISVFKKVKNIELVVLMITKITPSKILRPGTNPRLPPPNSASGIGTD
jgi:hypothetical protein